MGIISKGLIVASALIRALKTNLTNTTIVIRKDTNRGLEEIHWPD